jgi:hypothetical protein
MNVEHMQNPLSVEDRVREIVGCAKSKTHSGLTNLF